MTGDKDLALCLEVFGGVVSSVGRPTRLLELCIVAVVGVSGTRARSEAAESRSSLTPGICVFVVIGGSWLCNPGEPEAGDDDSLQ